MHLFEPHATVETLGVEWTPEYTGHLEHLKTKDGMRYRNQDNHFTANKDIS